MTPEQALANATRRRILELLATEDPSVNDLVVELGITQPAVSKHLKVLKEAGLVTVVSVGKKRFYRINREEVLATIDRMRP